MEQISFTIIVALLALLLSCLTLALAIVYRRRAAKLSRELTISLEKLATAHADIQLLEQRYQDNLAFQKTLSDAEITTRLQQPRLSAAHGYSQISAPERYLYIRSLAQNGMGAKEIAAILSISSHEAEQLVNLSRLANTPS